MAKVNKNREETQVVSDVALHTAALRNILEVLDGKEDYSEKVGLAMKYLGYESRTDALKHGRNKLAFMMVRALTDPVLLRKYVTTTAPEIKRLNPAMAEAV